MQQVRSGQNQHSEESILLLQNVPLMTMWSPLTALPCHTAAGPPSYRTGKAPGSLSCFSRYLHNAWNQTKRWCVCVRVCVYMCTYVFCPLSIPPRPALRLYYHRYERFLIRIATLLTPPSKARNPVYSVSYIIYSLLGRFGLAYHS